MVFFLWNCSYCQGWHSFVQISHRTCRFVLGMGPWSSGYQELYLQSLVDCPSISVPLCPGLSLTEVSHGNSVTPSLGKTSLAFLPFISLPHPLQKDNTNEQKQLRYPVFKALSSQRKIQYISNLEKCLRSAELPLLRCFKPLWTLHEPGREINEALQCFLCTMFFHSQSKAMSHWNGPILQMRTLCRKVK